MADKMPMDDETLTDLLNVHADTDDSVRKAFAEVDKLFLSDNEEEIVRTCIYLSFWAGVEATLFDDDFKSAVKRIYDEHRENGGGGEAR